MYMRCNEEVVYIMSSLTVASGPTLPGVGHLLIHLFPITLYLF